MILNNQQNSDIRLGVYVCHCGNNIAKMVDVQDVSERAGKLPGVSPM